MKIQFLIFILSFFLFGCAKNAYDYSSLTPKTYNSEFISENKSVCISAKHCKAILPKNYKNENLSLAELIDIGLMNNPNTKITWSEAKAKAAAYGQSLSKYYPEIDVIGTAKTERQSNVLPGSSQTFDLTTYTPEMQISYTIFDFGLIKNTSVVAREALYYANFTHNREIQTVLQTVMNDYYDVEFQKQQLYALEEDLVNANASLDAAFEQFDTGMGSINSITQAKTKFLQTKLELINQKNNLQISLATLKNNLGVPANIDLSLQAFPENVEVTNTLLSIDKLIKKAQKNRFDLLAEEANVRKNEANVKAAKSNFLPALTSNFDLGKNYYQQHHNEDYHYSLSIALKFALFKGFYDQNKIKKAKAELCKAKSQLALKELDVIKDVTIAQHSVKLASDSILCAKDYYETSQKNFDISLAKYKQGFNTILDVLEAQSDLADARAKYAKSKKTWFSSLANLAYSTGIMCGQEI